MKYQQNCELGFAVPNPDAPNPSCGQADGDGVAILSRLPFQDVPDQTLLWGRDQWTDARSALRVKVRVGNQDVQVFGTHLAPSAGGAPGNWTGQRRMARELSITAMRIELKAGTWKAETGAPGTVVFDNLLAVRP